MSNTKYFSQDQTRFSVVMRTITLLPVLLLSIPQLAVAQITPDTTLGSENSSITSGVNSQNESVDLITGGATRGSSLFHSFLEFNVNNGQRVYFDNPANINNIFSRVTGNNVSHILGTLGVNGTANLYLLNPKGIIFGKDATLDIQGSFFATTANSFIFPDGSEFSATNPQMPLLTMSVPEGVQFGLQPGDISSQGNLRVGKDLTFTGRNLDLQGQLITGGDLTLEASGNLQVSNTEITSTSETENAGNISLIANGDVSIKNSQVKSDIPENAIGFSTIRIESEKGSVDIDNAIVMAQNEFSGLAGDIYINAKDRIQLKNSYINAEGYFGRIFLGLDDSLFFASNDSFFPEKIEINHSFLTTTNAIKNLNPVEADAGNVEIKTGSLYLTNGAVITSNTYGQGSSGNITIVASNITSLDDSVLSNVVGSGAVGNAGNVNIKTGSLYLTNDAEITSSTYGQGSSGNITIVASNITSLDQSFLSNAVQAGAVGNAGNVDIKTGSLYLTDGAIIDSSTFSTGHTGNISIEAKDTISINDSQLYNQVEKTGVGNGGSIDITAQDLSLSNQSQITASALGAGNAGNIKITSSNINLNSKAIIEVNNENIDPESSAGTIILKTDFLKLDNGFLSAKNESGKGGNINISSQILLLRNDSQISSKAGSRENRGNGGTITINAEDGYIIAVPTEDSDIIANAFSGTGGKINIHAIQTFGLIRKKGLNTASLEKIPDNRSSDISASSDSGDDGDVEIETLSIDPSQGLVAIPTDLVDPSGLIAQDCNSNNSNSAQSQSEFVITGRGGLPPSPDDVLTAGALPAKWVTREKTISEMLPMQLKPPTAIKPLVEAQAMVRSANGDIVLISQPVISTNFQSGLSGKLCGIDQKI